MSEEKSWYQRVKETVSENISLIVSVSAVAVASYAVIRASDSAQAMTEANEVNEQILKTIEEKIGTAIEAPTIVKVEVGDDLELFGWGNRTD